MNMTSRKLWHFHGGLQLDDHKSISNTLPVKAAAIPSQLVLPLSQHIGNMAIPNVQPGERVLKGQRIARCDGYVSAPVHAPTSGTVVAIEEHPIPHPSGLSAPCIIINADGEDEWIEHSSREDYTGLDASELRNIIREAGIVGLGGAGFPSYIKLNPGTHKVKTLILNGAECEPYITCDDILMRERADEIIYGMRIMQHALQADECIIGVEDNKVEAFAALRDAIGEAQDIQLVRIPTRYPAGGEKQLIYTLTGKQVPSQGLPLDIGVVCHNVGTAAAVYRAIVHGEPLLSRIVTLTGSGIPQPRNLEVLFGTRIKDLLAQVHSDADKLGTLLMGGPMMGFELIHSEAPVIKTTNCLLAQHPRDVDEPPAAMPCIRCGDCATVCPALLLPQQLYWHAQSREFDRIQDYHLFDCIECGCCSYVCPSHIPLVQYYRFAKTEIWQQERDKQKSDAARQRHEARLERLEREKREKKERHARKAAALKQKDEASSKDKVDPKKAAIMAALERVQKKKQQSHVEPKNIEHLTEEQQREIDEVNARRAASHKQDKEPS
jgi:electron transport complex protein RnfC